MQDHKNEIVLGSEAQLPAVQTEREALMDLITRVATDPNADVEKFERVLAVYERIKSKDSEQGYNNAMTSAQAEMRPIAADANMGRRLRTLVVSVAPHVGGGAGTGSSSAAGATTAAWASNPSLRIYDGDEITGSLLYASDLPTALPFQYPVPLPSSQAAVDGVSDGGLYFTPGGIGTVLLAGAGPNITSNLNAELVSA